MPAKALTGCVSSLCRFEKQSGITTAKWHISIKVSGSCERAWTTC